MLFNTRTIFKDEHSPLGPTAAMVLPGPLIETWVLYAAGTLIIFARILCRWRMIGPSNFKTDDYLIVPAWVRCLGP